MPWREIAVTGNALRHRYFRVQRKIIAAIVWHDLPALKTVIESFWQQAGYEPLLPPQA